MDVKKDERYDMVCRAADASIVAREREKERPRKKVSVRSNTASKL